MKGLLFGWLASVIMPVPVGISPSAVRPVITSSVIASDWQLSSQLAEACTAQVDGAVDHLDGASLSVDCARDVTVVGNISGSAAAHAWRQRRVTVSAELQVHDMTASLWLKTQNGSRVLMFDDDSEQAMWTDTPADGWVRRSVTLPVAAEATQVSFGVLLQGVGELVVRDMRVTVSEPGAIAPEAVRWLDAAIAVIKQQTLGRRDLQWQVLEPQLRLFAAGARNSAEAYPAIKYLLSRLGDKRSLLITPEVSAALSQHAAGQAAANSVVNLFELPDGAQLVLSRANVDTPVRTAQNRVAPVALP